MSQSISDTQMKFIDKILGEKLSTGYQGSVDKLSQYWDFLCSAQQTQNLCGWHEPEIWIKKAVFDTIGPIRDIPKNARVLDVGAGSGLPGCVIACIRPDIELISVELRKKRALFLKELYQHLNISGTVMCDDIKNVRTDADIITARAVGQPDDLIKMTQHLAKESTIWVLPQTPCEVVYTGAWHSVEIDYHHYHWWVSRG